MPADPDCLFCKIVAGDVPADVVRTTETTLAIRDINPQAPTHVLILPKQHLENAAEVASADPALLAALVTEAAQCGEVVLGQGVLDLVLELGPGGPVELDVRRRLATRLEVAVGHAGDSLSTHGGSAPVAPRDTHRLPGRRPRPR